MTLVADHTAVRTTVEARPVFTSLRRGFFGHCPHCGEGKIFRAYLKVNDHCPSCNEALHHQRADDAPPYITMLVVGHVLIALFLASEDYGPTLPASVAVALFCAIGIGMSLALLPRVKGALIGLQWALRMHGFHGPDGESAERTFS